MSLAKKIAKIEPKMDRVANLAVARLWPKGIRWSRVYSQVYVVNKSIGEYWLVFVRALRSNRVVKLGPFSKKSFTRHCQPLKKTSKLWPEWRRLARYLVPGQSYWYGHIYSRHVGIVLRCWLFVTSCSVCWASVSVSVEFWKHFESVDVFNSCSLIFTCRKSF